MTETKMIADASAKSSRQLSDGLLFGGAAALGFAAGSRAERFRRV